jgi:uncharacterized protein YjbI with pentapeptide repeats
MVGQQYTLTARANWGWRLKKITYNLPGSSTAYVTGLGDSLVFGMPQSGTVTAVFEPEAGASPPATGVNDPEIDVGATIALWNSMTDAQRIEYGIAKFLAEGLDPRLLTPPTRAYADWATIWKYFGWSSLTEDQRKTVPLAQIWGRPDVVGYVITEGDIKAGYFTGDNGQNTAFLRYFNFAGGDLSGLRMGEGFYTFSEANFAGANLSGLDFGPQLYALHNANLVGADIRGYKTSTGTHTFYHSNMRGNNLSGVAVSGRRQFWGTDLSEADLRGMDFSAARETFWYAILRGANLAGESSDGSSGWGAYANFTGANLAGFNGTGSQWLGELGNFSGANLAGGNFFGGGGQLSRADLSGANLNGANFFGSNNSLYGSNFAGADLRNINVGGEYTFFTAGNYSGVRSGGIIGRDADLGGGWFLHGGYIFGPHVNLAGANLSGLNLASYNLSGVQVIPGGIVGDANTRLPAGWQIKDGYLFGVNVNLSGANFSGLNLEGVNFSGVSFHGGGVKIDSNTKLPAGWRYLDGLIIPTTGQIDISGFNLGGVNLSQLNISGWRTVNLTGTPTALPAGYQLLGGIIAGPGVNLHGGNVGGVNLSGINLSGATLANMQGTSSAILPEGWTWVAPRGSRAEGYGVFAVGPGGHLGSTTLGPHFYQVDFSHRNLQSFNFASLPGSWQVLYNGSNLAGANFGARSSWQNNFVGANLVGVNMANGSWYQNNFAGSNMAGMNMANGSWWQNNFVGVRSGGIIGSDMAVGDTDETPWVLRGGYILGPGVNLSGANLRGFNLLSVNLTGSIFGGGGLVVDGNTKLPAGWQVIGGYAFGSSVDLSGANFSGLNLEGVNFSGISFPGGGVKIDSNTKLPGGWVYVGGYILRTGGFSTPWTIDISGANIEGVDLTQFNISGWRAVNVTGTPRGMPDGYAILNGSLVGPRVNLIGANLAGADLSSYNLQGSQLFSVNLSGAVLPSGWLSVPIAWSGYSGDVAVGPGGNLAGSHAAFRSANLAGWNLVGANFAGNFDTGAYANFSGANLAGGNFAGIRASGFASNFTGANLSGVNFAQGSGGLNVSNSNFSNAILTGANFANNSMNAGRWDGVISGGIQGGDRSLGSGWSLRGGYIVGPSANLTGANLTGMNFSGVNLSGANLQGAAGTGLQVDASTILPSGWSVVNGILMQP